MNGNSYEKAKLNGIIVPLAGAVAFGALVLAIVFTAAFAGAFSGDYRYDPESGSAYLESSPDPLPGRPEVELIDGSYYGKDYIVTATYTPNGDNLYYNVALNNRESADVTVDSVSIECYSGAEFIKRSVIAVDVLIKSRERSALGGSIYAPGCDYATVLIVLNDGERTYALRAECEMRSL